MHGADHLKRFRQLLRLAADDLGDAEVGDLHAPLLVEENVFRLDVAVNDAGVVGVLERVAELRDDAQRLARRELARAQDVAQVGAVDEFHHDVVAARDFSEFMDGDDVLMRQRRERPGFPVEALDELGILGQIVRQHLDGDVAFELRLSRAVNGAHSAAADPFDDLDAGDRRGRLGVGGDGARGEIDEAVWAHPRKIALDALGGESGPAAGAVEVVHDPM